MHAHIVNTRTGERTRYTVVWPEDTCTRCLEPLPDDQDNDIGWMCDDCTELAILAQWDSMSNDAQDHAVMRGYGY